MYRRIVVPLDGSELAETALPYAEELAGSLGSELTLIHVSESADDEFYNMRQSYMEKMVEVTMHGAGRFGDEPIEVSLAHLVGHTAEQIVDYVDQEKIGLVVMATHGQSGLKRWFMGSVADKVVRATTKPVMLIRVRDTQPEVRGKRRTKRLLKKALVSLDGSKDSESVVSHIKELASKLKMEVVLLHVVAPVHFFYSIPGETVTQPYSPEEISEMVNKSEGYLDTLSTELKDIGIKTKSRVEVGAPAEEIIRVSDEIQANMVAMSTHGHSGIGRWAFGSTTDKVLQAGNTPIFLVRASGATIT